MNASISEGLGLVCDIIKIGILAAQQKMKNSTERKQKMQEVKADLLARIANLKKKLLKK